MKSVFNLVCLTIVILASHYASANQNEFKINAEKRRYIEKLKTRQRHGLILGVVDLDLDTK